MEETQTIQKCKKCGEILNEEDYVLWVIVRNVLISMETVK